MSKRIRRFVRNTAGAALVEYALIVAGVALVGAAALSVFGNKVTDLVAMAAAIIPGAHSATRDPFLPKAGMCFMGPGSRMLRVLARDDSRENSLRLRPRMTKGTA